MSKSVIKTIIKEFANTPAVVAREILRKLQTEEERAEALRIFYAVGITAEDITKGGAKK